MITKNLKKLGSMGLFALGFWASVTGMTGVLTPVHATVLGEDGWEEIYNEDGIRGWRKEVPGSPMIAFRGEAIVDAHVSKVAQVLADSSRKTEWIHRCVKAQTLEEVSDLERFEYNHTAMPAILTDRDFVFHAKVELDRPKQQVRIFFQSADHPNAPKTNNVRGRLIESRYILTSMGDGSKTKALVEIHADPMGSVPKWLVNIFQKAWPKNTLTGIRKQVAKSDVQELSRLREFMAGKIKGVPDVVTSKDALKLGLLKK